MTPSHLHQIRAEAETEANACLIAAAPDLLSALKECAVQIAQNRNRRLTRAEEAALDNARSVIAKAEASK